MDRPLACTLLDQNIKNDYISDLMAIAKICHKNENTGKKAVKKAIELVKNTDDFVRIAPMAKKFLGKKETIKFLKQGYFLEATQTFLLKLRFYRRFKHFIAYEKNTKYYK